MLNIDIYDIVALTYYCPYRAGSLNASYYQLIWRISNLDNIVLGTKTNLSLLTISEL